MLIPWLALHWTVAVIRALASLPFASASVQLSAAGLVGYFAKDGELDLKANSLVLWLSWGRTSVLLLGDATRGQERMVEGGEWREEGGG